MGHHNPRTIFAVVIVGACLVKLLSVLQSTLKLVTYESTLTVPPVNGHLTRGTLRCPEIHEMPTFKEARSASETDAILALFVTARAGIDTSSLSYIDKVMNRFSRVWVSNETRKTGIRKKLNSVLDAKEFAVMTKRFVKIGQKIRFAITNTSRELTKDVYTSLPEQSPFDDTPQRCIVVGNGGILTNSRCGTEINSADFVFRCNTPPLGEYKEDAGTKTSVTSINPNTVIATKYKRLLDQGQRSKFLHDMKKYGRLLVPLYGMLSGYIQSVTALKLLQTSRSAQVDMLIINPDHFRAMAGLWAEMGLKDRMTTGFYLTSLALSVCGSVELFGFWPFPIDTIGNPVPYHYYGKDRITQGMHDFNLEFALLHELHIDGVLRMQVGSCVSTP